MRVRQIVLTVAALLACSCAHDAATTPTADTCASIAADYAAAMPEALGCEPATVNPCTAQRPLTHALGDQVEGLCWVANSGYIDPARAKAVDNILADYAAAACTIGACPGPGPHDTVCRQNQAGVYTCGGL